MSAARFLILVLTIPLLSGSPITYSVNHRVGLASVYGTLTLDWTSPNPINQANILAYHLTLSGPTATATLDQQLPGNLVYDGMQYHIPELIPTDATLAWKYLGYIHPEQLIFEAWDDSSSPHVLIGAWGFFDSAPGMTPHPMYESISLGNQFYQADHAVSDSVVIGTLGVPEAATSILTALGALALVAESIRRRRRS